jgi:hypothetical protein
MLAVRSFLRDHKRLNRITDGEEHSDRLVGQSVLALTTDFARTPPPLGFFTVSQILDDFYLYNPALRFCSHFLIDSLVNLMIRNEIPHSDGGLSVQFGSNIQMLQRQSATYRQEWEEAKKQSKIVANIEGMEGIASPTSEYSILLSWVGELV